MLLIYFSSYTNLKRQDDAIELLFYRLDTNHDGVVELDEFKQGYEHYLNVVQARCFHSATRKLEPKVLLRTDDPIPHNFRTVPWSRGSVRLYKATYPANDPSEDRSTLVVGDDFVFAGVWDGVNKCCIFYPLLT